MEHTLTVSPEQLSAARRLRCPCEGLGSLVTFPDGKPVWFDCPACGKDRQNTAFGPATIHCHTLHNIVGKNSFKLSDFPESALMAHVMHKAGVFPSIGQARKNGWDRPIEVGSWTVTKKKIRIEVV